jgi:hypothetical protein
MTVFGAWTSSNTNISRVDKKGFIQHGPSISNKQDIQAQITQSYFTIFYHILKESFKTFYAAFKKDRI